MATRALSGFCILFLLLSAFHVLPSTEAARILDEDKAAGAESLRTMEESKTGSIRYNPRNPNKSLGGAHQNPTLPCHAKKGKKCPPPLRAP